MYIDTLAYQTKEFFYSLGLGFILGMIYDLTRIVRLAVYNGKKKAAVFDVFFAAAAAFLSVIFVLSSCRGNFAFYVVCGIAVGFAVYFFTLGAVFGKIAEKIIVRMKGLFSKISGVFGGFAAFIMRVMVKLIKRLRFRKKKSKNNSKKHLQQQ